MITFSASIAIEHAARRASPHFAFGVALLSLVALAHECRADPQFPMPAAGPGCSATAAAVTGESRRAIQIGLQRREYLLYVPKSYSPSRSAPLVLNMHGAGGNAEIERNLTRFNDAADKHGFLVAYPEGTPMLIGRGRMWNSGGCCGTAGRRSIDDVAFLGRVISDIERDHCVDQRRVYATGMSNGAMMSYRLACDMSHRIAAIAPVAGTMQIEGCRPNRPVAILHFHGTADDRVPYEGGRNAFGDFISVADTIRFWRQNNGCAHAARPYLSRGIVVCVAYPACKPNGNVVLCDVKGGGHTWPGATHARMRGVTAADTSATEEISSFFLLHTLG